MKFPGGTHSPAKFPPILFSNDLNSSTDLNPSGTADRNLHRRKTRKPNFAGAGIRLRKYGTPVGKASDLTTPLLRWKFDDNAPVTGPKGSRRARSGGVVSASARKLAAGLWQLRLAAEVAGGGIGRDSQCRSYDQPSVGHARMAFPCHHNSGEYGAETKDVLECPRSVSGPENGILYKVDSSLQFPKSAMEGATKWDTGCPKTYDEAYRFYSHMKLLEEQQGTTVSVVSALQAELVKARARIHKLEAERRSSKNKIELFLRKLGEERTSWQRREHRKIRGIIDDLKDELNRERKNRQRMDIVNSKLVNELADAKLSAKQFMQDYDKERKARELMEEVCNELAKEIGDDKAEVEALKRESMKIREEGEEERKMLQMAEVWREERVQMKLVDAKLTLEDKYSQMNKLIADLETFLSSRGATLGVMELKEAELIRRAVNSVKIQDIKEFSYVPPKSDDIFSIFEELQNGESNIREVEPCIHYSPASYASKIHTVSPEVNGFNKNTLQKNSNGFNGHNRGLEEDASGWETHSHAEDQGSSYSDGGSDLSVDRISRDRNVSRSGTEWDKNAGQDSPNTEISEVCSVSEKQSKQKASSVSKLWRSCPSNGDIYKIISVEGNGRLSNGAISNVTISPDRGSGEGGLSHRDLVGQCSSPDSGNPHITRGMKGCIEWPRGIQKNSLKAKLLEARIESQKMQLRHVLKQKS